MRSTSDYPKDWPKISLAIKKAARNRCEWCRKKDANIVTAHLDQEKSNCTNENLACLCGQCHHRYDMYGVSPLLPEREISSRINQLIILAEAITVTIRSTSKQRVPFDALIGWTLLIQDKLGLLREACKVLSYYKIAKTLRPSRTLPSYVWWKGFRGGLLFR